MNTEGKLRICICGGGALGTVCAAVFSSQGNEVSLLTKRPERWNSVVEAYDPDGKVFKGSLSVISDSALIACRNADIVLLCVPGYLIRKTLEEIKPSLTEQTLVGSIVTTTGFFFMAHEVLSLGTPLFGFQRVPYIARIREYGKSASLLGYKDCLYVAGENCNLPLLCKVLEGLFHTPVIALPGYLEASLSNSNPLLHTARLYSMWRGQESHGWERPVKFYAEWSDEASMLLLEMDREFMHLVEKLGISQGSIKSVLQHYEVADAKSLTRKLRSIQAFQNIVSPMVERDGLWYPDFSSRYFTEDFPYGLKILIDLWEKHGIDHPVSRQVWEWGSSLICPPTN